MRLTVVGVGPGDPELITLKGIRAIEAAHLVFVPANRDGSESLALRVAEPWIDTTRQQVVHLTLAMTRNVEEASTFYAGAAAEIAATFAAHAASGEGEDVRGVYLLLGDPLLYGTFAAIGRELASRAPHIGVAIVPGITSFAATAAQAQVVLGSGDERVAIVPAHAGLDASALRRLLAECETLVLMKVGRVLPQVLDALDELGLLDAALFAERVGMPEEDIVRDVRVLRGQQRSYLSLLVVRR
jgi:precorrin-2/cobalt-factor-2 C20-methyltransferase